MAIKNILEQMQKDADAANNGDYLKLADKEQLRIRFLQELSEEAPGYDEARGLASYVKVHQNPKDFKKQALCTRGEGNGDCYGCEQYSKGTKETGRWKPKGRLYVNVLVKAADGDQIKVLQQSLFAKHVALTLMEFAAEYGSITDRDYKIKRTGTEMNNTSYSLTPLEKSDSPTIEGELHDLSTVVRHVPYDEQHDFYEATDAEGAGW